MRLRASILSAGLAMLLVAACGGGAARTPSPSPGASIIPSGTPVPFSAAPATASPGASAGPAATARPPASSGPTASAASTAPGPAGSASPLPLPTDSLPVPNRTLPPGTIIWPTSVIDATIALAVLHNEILKAGGDLTVAVQNKDMPLLLGASQGLATLMDESIPNAQKLTTWKDTKSVGEAYVPVLTAIRDAATALSTALLGADGPGVGTASQQLAAALVGYQAVEPGLVDLADTALIMRRGLLLK